MKILLNVGLARSPELSRNLAPLTVPEVLRALKNAGFLPVQCTLRQSATEQTAVVTVKVATFDAASLAAVATQLDQDAIAAYLPTERRGLLAGVRAAVWGAFNPGAFLLHSGQALA